MRAWARLFRRGFRLPGLALAIVAIAGGPGPARAQNNTAALFAIRPPPSWVRYAGEPGTDPPASPPGNEGQEYRLLDQQINGETEEHYLHVVKKITNQNGVQNGSRLEFPFDPAYEKLTIHSIQILRDGKTVNALEVQKIKVIQQETGLESHLYNGALMAVLFLEDVRVGDTIEYASTVKGANPILKGRFAGSFSVEWSAAARKQYYRLLWPTRRALTITNHKTLVQPTIRTMDGRQEYAWDIRDSAPIQVEDSLPVSYEAFGWVQLTEFASWQEVAEWALPLYGSASQELPEEFRRQIALWRLPHSQADQVRAVLRFVQDDVRYLGLEIGPNSHQPNEPGVVFSRRFGDCKDKVNLFCAALRELGITAHPVLVNTYSRGKVAEWAPSPFAFNHVVAVVELGDQTFWLDPTRSYQRGPLADLYFPEFDRGLIIAPGTTALTVIPRRASGQPLVTIVDRFTVTNYAFPTEYQVTTIEEGLAADRLRAELAGTRHEDLAKGQLNHFAKIYPKIKSVRPLDIKDDEDRNVITLQESYELTDAWQLSSDSKYWVLEFVPDDFFDFAKRPETSLRSQPLGVVHPRRRKQITEVMLPEPYSIRDETVTVEDRAVRFERQVSYSRQHLRVAYTFDSRADAVPVAAVPDHLQHLKQIREKIGFSIQHSNRRAEITTDSSEPNWSILGFGAGYFMLTVLGAGLAYSFRPRNSAAEPPVLQHPLKGLGGWLILLAINLVIRPFYIIGVLARGAPAYSLARWSALTTPGENLYQPLLGPVLWFELFLNLTLLTFSVLNIVLFFQKRFAFPRILAACLGFTVVMAWADYFLLSRIPTLPHGGPAVAAAHVRDTFFIGLWILYLIKSRRVKLTFIE